MSRETSIADPAEKRVWDALETVMDPEIPLISTVELGLIAGVEVDGAAATVSITPTFAACPALDLIRSQIREAVTAAGFSPVSVETVYDPPWTSDRVSESGRRKLKEFGLAPPKRMNGRCMQPQDLVGVACPYCDSTQTVLESAFGPTLCRSIHYCDGCRQSFEHFKPVT